MILTALSTPSIYLVYAWYEGVGLANDFGGVWWTDAQGFANIIDNYPNWNIYFLSNSPYPTWWKEESYGGMDNYMADYIQLSLILGHSADLGGGLIGVGFGTLGYTSPNAVRLGYMSPDNYGYAIWWFIIECSVFKDSSYPSWLYTLTGVHMLLGFKNDAVILSTDLRELANRLTGSGGYSNETVQYAFFHTYVDLDGTHNNNIARILAENTDVANNDKIDSFNSLTPVDATKIIITCSIGG